MGWSCEHEAGRVMERILGLHENGFIEHKGDKFFCEPVTREYGDGRILMKVYRVVDEGKGMCVEEGSFYIMPGGKVSSEAVRKFPFLEAVS